jgi:hypothetical protein
VGPRSRSLGRSCPQVSLQVTMEPRPGGPSVEGTAATAAATRMFPLGRLEHGSTIRTAVVSDAIDDPQPCLVTCWGGAACMLRRYVPLMNLGSFASRALERLQALLTRVKGLFAGVLTQRARAGRGSGDKSSLPDETWTVIELRAEARTRGLSGVSRMRKAELLKVLAGD